MDGLMSSGGVSETLVGEDRPCAFADPPLASDLGVVIPASDQELGHGLASERFTTPRMGRLPALPLHCDAR